MKDVISIGEFLSDYSFAEFLMFIIIFVLAIKEGISLFDWAKARFRKASNQAYEEKREHDKIEKEITVEAMENRYNDPGFVDPMPMPEEPESICPIRYARSVVRN